ncbi:hypothetical protein [Microcella sp.]|uniref:hypothetical protein n=1 Tax=Microcella sp. TaxID=1913979 RepID=UPI00299F5C8B|nr:hypothetical protein [Microcella sp.]MDX2026445.1 hypothetical protein [Microcella sp.]
MTTQPRTRRRGIIAAGITTGVVALTLGGIGVGMAQAGVELPFGPAVGSGGAFDLEGNPIPESELQTELGELEYSGDVSVDDMPAGESVLEGSFDE